MTGDFTIISCYVHFAGHLLIDFMNGWNCMSIRWNLTIPSFLTNISLLWNFIILEFLLNPLNTNILMIQSLFSGSEANSAHPIHATLKKSNEMIQHFWQ